jgi:hypothetical protein
MVVLEWLLQAGVIALLGAALPYVLRLERELRALRADRVALEASAAELSEATRMAEAASLRLRASAETAGRQVAEKLAAAEPLRDDLHFLVERAEVMADRLDGLVRHARGVLPAAPDPLRATLTPAVDVAPTPRPVPQIAVAAGPQPAPAASPDAPVAAAAAAPEADQGRSRAERELLRALLQTGPGQGAAA